MKTYRLESYTDNGTFIFKRGTKYESEHIHNFTEIIYISGGSGKEWIHGKEYDVKRGDLLMILPGESHKFRSNNMDFSFYNVMIQPELLKEYLYNWEDTFGRLLAKQTVGDPIHFFKDRDSVETLLENMLTECKMKDFGYFNALCGYTNVLLTMMQRKMSRPPEEKPNAWSEVIDYIDEHLDSRLTVVELAEKFYYNPSYFSRVFSQKTGSPFSLYVAERRLKKAAKLLRETEFSIDEIALICGFSEKSTFYRNFRKKYGLSPALYRKS